MNLPVQKQQPMLSINHQEWNLLKEQATVLVSSGILPNWIDKPEKAVAVALKGREMGIPMMQAFTHIFMVNGKVGVGSELQLAQIYKNCPGAKIEILTNTTEKAEVRATRPGEVASVFEFTMLDANTAGLTGKGPWKQYPKTMLLWRAISMMARAKFPDAIMGFSYTPEELGADVNEDGEVISLEPESAPDYKIPEKAYPQPVPNQTTQNQNFKPIISPVVKEAIKVAETGGAPKAGFAGYKVTDKQLSRMFAMAKQHNRSNDEIKAWLADRGLKSSRELTRKPYDDLCAWIEQGLTTEAAEFLGEPVNASAAKNNDSGIMDNVPF